VLNEKSGAGLPSKGDGISCGLRLSPMARKATNTKKIPSGIKNFFIEVASTQAAALKADLR
jgi:hypothetical protein